jgi:urease accessory protein UreF
MASGARRSLRAVAASAAGEPSRSWNRSSPSRRSAAPSTSCAACLCTWSLLQSKHMIMHAHGPNTGSNFLHVATREMPLDTC